MYWTLQTLKGSEKKQEILQYGSILSAAMVGSKVLYELQGLSFKSTP
jgi:hypothetical protein